METGKNIVIVSDLHMGDGTKTDNFQPAKDRFTAFLDYFESLENSVLVLNGDIFEFWQSSMVDVFYHNHSLVKRLVEDEAIFVAGNHDYELLTLAKLPRGGRKMQIAKEITFELGGKLIRIIHGNEFDPFNQPGKAAFTGKLMALIFADLEENNPNSGIEGWFQQNVEPVARTLILFFSTVYRILFTNNSKLSGHLDIALEEYHKNFPNHILVAGHTHKAGWWNNFYVNSGTWQEDNDAFYTVINTDGNIKLFAWPSQEEVTKQTDLYGYISQTAVRNLYNNREPLF